jgi:hypothetical protein
VDSQIELGFILDARRHQSSGVERNHNRLIALNLVLARGQLAAPRRRRPGHMPQLIAAHVVAQGFKLASLAAPGALAMGSGKRASAERFQFRFPRSPHVRVDLNAGGQAHARLLPDQPEA